MEFLPFFVLEKVCILRPFIEQLSFHIAID